MEEALGGCMELVSSFFAHENQFQVSPGISLQILRRQEFFGQYGKVLQIVVNKNQG